MGRRRWWARRGGKLPGLLAGGHARSAGSGEAVCGSRIPLVAGARGIVMARVRVARAVMARVRVARAVIARAVVPWVALPPVFMAWRVEPWRVEPWRVEPWRATASVRVDRMVPFRMVPFGVPGPARESPVRIWLLRTGLPGITGIRLVRGEPGRAFGRRVAVLVAVPDIGWVPVRRSTAGTAITPGVGSTPAMPGPRPALLLDRRHGPLRRRRKGAVAAESPVSSWLSRPWRRVSRSWSS
ncbi:hypothetical protein BMG523Draft_02561 [Frankia sp. BMG5.23]|nr:hypothetical protein BMG523Draft_02561 [Frankia sp. BMG5.23]